MIINMNGAKAPETPSSVLQEKTVTPETLPTVIGPDEGYDGLTQVTVNPDPQLKPENIRSGKSIFGVTGAFEGAVKLTGGIPFDEVWSDSDNGTATIVLHRFTSDELVATDEAAPSQGYRISYGNETPTPIIRWYNSSTGIEMGRFSSVINNYINASWWSTKLQTPSVTIPAQTITIPTYMIRTHWSVKRILARFGIAVMCMRNDTESYVGDSTYAANKKENLTIMDIEMDNPSNEARQIEIPEITIQPTHVYNSSYSYAVVLCVISWVVIE